MYKFYKGEEENPYVGEIAVFWGYERIFHHNYAPMNEFYGSFGKDKESAFKNWINMVLDERIPEKSGVNPKYVRDSYHSIWFFYLACYLPFDALIDVEYQEFTVSAE